MGLSKILLASCKICKNKFENTMSWSWYYMDVCANILYISKEKHTTHPNDVVSLHIIFKEFSVEIKLLGSPAWRDPRVWSVYRSRHLINVFRGLRKIIIYTLYMCVCFRNLAVAFFCTVFFKLGIQNRFYNSLDKFVGINRKAKPRYFADTVFWVV